MCCVNTECACMMREEAGFIFSTIKVIDIFNSMYTRWFFAFVHTGCGRILDADMDLDPKEPSYLDSFGLAIMLCNWYVAVAGHASGANLRILYFSLVQGFNWTQSLHICSKPWQCCLRFHKLLAMHWLYMYALTTRDAAHLGTIICNKVWCSWKHQLFFRNHEILNWQSQSISVVDLRNRHIFCCVKRTEAQRLPFFQVLNDVVNNGVVFFSGIQKVLKKVDREVCIQVLHMSRFGWYAMLCTWRILCL